MFGIFLPGFSMDLLLAVISVARQGVERIIEKPDLVLILHT